MDGNHDDDDDDKGQVYVTYKEFAKCNIRLERRLTRIEVILALGIGSNFILNLVAILLGK